MAEPVYALWDFEDLLEEAREGNEGAIKYLEELLEDYEESKTKIDDAIKDGKEKLQVGSD